MNLSSTAKVLFAIIACQLAGIIGSVFTMPAIPGWYASLSKPFFNPPSWVFAPAWILLYTLMGIAVFLVWEKGISQKEVRIGISLFGIQLALNALWSFIFFGMQNLAISFAEIILLWIFIAATTVQFKKISRRAFFLMLPYLAWVSFAAILNLSIWLLNA